MDVPNVASTGIYTILELIMNLNEMRVKMNVFANLVVILSAVSLQ